MGLHLADKGKFLRRARIFRELPPNGLDRPRDSVHYFHRIFGNGRKRSGRSQSARRIFNLTLHLSLNPRPAMRRLLKSKVPKFSRARAVSSLSPFDRGHAGSPIQSCSRQVAADGRLLLTAVHGSGMARFCPQGFLPGDVFTFRAVSCCSITVLFGFVYLLQFTRATLASASRIF